MTAKLLLHPLADLMPAMSEQEYAELRGDIEENGLLAPITLFDGKVLDGRHRARVCDELGIEPKTHNYVGDEPARFVLSMNVHRRHLTTTQRALIAKAAMPHLKEEAAKRRREHGGTAPGRPANTPGTNSTSVPSRAVVTDKGPETRARDEAGAAVGVSGKTILAA